MFLAGDDDDGAVGAGVDCGVSKTGSNGEGVGTTPPPPPLLELELELGPLVDELAAGLGVIPRPILVGAGLGVVGSASLSGIVSAAVPTPVIAALCVFSNSARAGCSASWEACSLNN